MGSCWGGVKKDSDRVVNRILIIDDEDDFRQVIIKLLTRQGFEVVAASDGKSGVSLAAETLPDLIVCDLNMPGMDGYEVLVALRQDPRLADIPLIFLTGQSKPSQVRQGMNLGADDYLTKPVDLGDLLGAVKIRLSRRQAQRQRQEKQMERAMQLFGGIVHDLRDPLFVVLGYTDLLKRDPGKTPASGDNSRQMLDRMQQAILRMQAIISETLFLARSRMQRLPFDPGPFDLREFCEQMAADHVEHQRVQFQCAPGRFPIAADALRLRQALDNLLSNALKYSSGPVVVSLSQGSPDYLIEIKDQGIGIPAGEQAGLFEPFFRASNTGNKPGHGLGLSIVKSCIEQHGGTVRFTSEEGKGTTFSVEIPRAPRPVAQGGEEGPRALPVFLPKDLPKTASPVAIIDAPVCPSQPPGNGPEAAPENSAQLSGIIVDDDSLVRSVLRDLLETTHDILIVGEAGTVAQARSLAAQHEPDVVFLDVTLPDGTGFDLLPDLKASASVVFVSSAEEYAVHAFDCDAVDYLMKPVTPERLQQALTRVQQRLEAKPVVTPAIPKPGDSFLVKTLTEKRLVKVAEIDRIIAYGEYSWVYWQTNRKGALLRKSLKHWELELPAEQFIRVHRRAIINLAWMDRIEKLDSGRMQIHLRDNPEPILVSLRLAPVLNRKLKALRGQP